MNGPDLVVPDAWLRCVEKRELLRVAAQSALDRSGNGRSLDPEARAWATHWAGMERLRVPLSAGEPSGARALLAAA